MNSNLEKAKKMFFDYGCSDFYMMKEGVEKEYKKFGISVQQEKLWTEEYVANKLAELSNGNLDVLHSLNHIGSQETLDRLFGLLNEGDSYAKFWIAHTILSLSTKSLIKSKKGKEIALQAFKELVDGKIEISKENKLKIDTFMMQALKFA